VGKIFPECFSFILISVQEGELMSVGVGGENDEAGPWPNWDHEAAALEDPRKKIYFGNF